MFAKNLGRRLVFGVLICILVAFLQSCAATDRQQNELNLEEPVCGYKEPIIFWFWNKAAGDPDPSRLDGLPNVGDVSIKTKDGRILKGYTLKTSSFGTVSAASKGYLLVAQGNAMIADQILKSFVDFSQAGYDVYIFDYRGYGRSEGKRRLKAILSDYGEIIDHLNSLSYSTRLFYGMSFGGIVLLDALKFKSGDNLVVIDSTPSRLSSYGCPEEHDPVRNLPEDSSNLLIIVSGKDPVVKPEASKELFDLAKERGASVLWDPELGHTFMDRDISLHKRRMKAIKAFLLREQ